MCVAVNAPEEAVGQGAVEVQPASVHSVLRALGDPPIALVVEEERPGRAGRHPVLTQPGRASD